MKSVCSIGEIRRWLVALVVAGIAVEGEGVSGWGTAWAAHSTCGLFATIPGGKPRRRG